MSAQSELASINGRQIAPHLTLRSVLGEGATAVVYEALHQRLGLPVAVKVFAMSGELATDVARRLVREARICARLNDPHFAHIYDVSTLEDGRPYVVMERVNGRSLDARLAEGPMGVGEALRVTRELLQALCITHAQGIVHRDLKPANVLLEDDAGGQGGVRLMDFGIARIDDDASGMQSGVQPTQLGQILGTPGYMAPEQICGDRIDARADLYALGVVLFEMLVGRIPLPADTLTEMLHRPLHEDVPDVGELVEGCPAEVARWVARATAREPQDRFDSAEAALAALPDRVAPKPVPVQRPRGATRTLAAVAAGLGVWLCANTATMTATMGDAPAPTLAAGAVEVPRKPSPPSPAQDVSHTAPPAVLGEAPRSPLPPERRAADAPKPHADRPRPEVESRPDTPRPQARGRLVSEYVDALDDVMRAMASEGPATSVSASPIPDNPY